MQLVASKTDGAKELTLPQFVALLKKVCEETGIVVA
jgi:hypothetical protein